MRRSLERAIVGRLIADVRLLRREMVAMPEDPAGGFSRSRAERSGPIRRVPKRDLLAGQRIERVCRHGKQLALVSDAGRVLNVHLGMTGQFLCSGAGQRLAQQDHVHVVWRLEDGGGLAFRDPRRFGGIWTCRDEEDLRSRRWGTLGPDAAEIRASDLAAGLVGSRRAIKAVLLDQRVIAGVGNIYADEALFRARILPQRPGGSLTGGEVTALCRTIRTILRDAIEAGGSTLRDYRDAEGRAGAYQQRHSVYGRGGQACRVCSGVLCSAAIGQRTTVWCSGCQR